MRINIVRNQINELTEAYDIFLTHCEEMSVGLRFRASRTYKVILKTRKENPQAQMYLRETFKKAQELATWIHKTTMERVDGVYFLGVKYPLQGGTPPEPPPRQVYALPAMAPAEPQIPDYTLEPGEIAEAPSEEKAIRKALPATRQRRGCKAKYQWTQKVKKGSWK